MKKTGKIIKALGVVSIMAIPPVTALCSDAGLSSPQPLACESDPACQRASWTEEFERICIQTDSATLLGTGQLQKLIRDSDELMQKLEKLPASQAKVYIFRLKNCRAFFVYALQLAEPER